MPTGIPSRRARLRAIAVVLSPVVIIGVLLTWLLASSAEHNLRQQSLRFGNSIAAQLAITTSDYLVNRDALSLNIMLRDLLDDGNFGFAAVHDADRNLVAQAGKPNERQAFFTRDITFQDTAIGHLRLGLTPHASPTQGFVLGAATLILSFVACIAAAIWFRGHLLVPWLTGSTGPGKGLPVVTIPDTEDRLTSHPTTCWLTVKLKPGRLVDGHQDKLASACELYGGDQHVHGDNINVTFSTGEHLHNSMRCALLIKEIAGLIPGNVSYGAGIDIGQDMDTTQKHAAYLASISDGQLLVSQRVHQRQNERPDTSIQLSEYHHLLVGEGEVYSAAEAGNSSLFRNQASHLGEDLTPYTSPRSRSTRSTL